MVWEVSISKHQDRGGVLLYHRVYILGNSLPFIGTESDNSCKDCKPLKPYSDQESGNYNRFSYSKNGSLWFFLQWLLYARNVQIAFAENPWIQKPWYLIYLWPNKAFKSIVVNRTLPSLNRGSLKNTLTRPLKGLFNVE